MIEQDPWTTGAGVGLSEIRARLPARCFQRSLWRSMGTVLSALVLGAALVWGAATASSAISAATQGFPRWALLVALYAAYAFAQGLVLFALFLVGHDCAHHAFSRYPRLNQVMGNVVQTLTLVPHTPWRLSHNHHHAVTNNLDDDEGFGPLREGWASEAEARGILAAYSGLGLSYFFYFLRGVKPHSRTHLKFWDPFFARKRWACAVSAACYLVWVSALLLALALWPAARVPLLLYYALPLLVYGSLAVLVFFAHHNDAQTRWYSRRIWRKDVVLRTGTVDRSLGPLLDRATLHITFHQVHHLFPDIPHYHLREASLAFRREFPQLACVSAEPFLAVCRRNLALLRQRGRVADDADLVNLYDGPSAAPSQSPKPDALSPLAPGTR